MRRVLLVAAPLLCSLSAWADVCSVDFSNGVPSVSMAVTFYDGSGASVFSGTVRPGAVDAYGVQPGLSSFDVVAASGPVLLEAVPSGSPASLGRSVVQLVPGGRVLVRLEWGGVGSAVAVSAGAAVPSVPAGVDRWAWFWAGWTVLFPVIAFRWVFRMVARTTHAGGSGEVMSE